MNAENEKGKCAEHLIHMQGRERLEIRGVTDVISFDEQTVVLDTVCGSLAVEGMGLHIHVLDLGQGIVSMDGTVQSLGYFQSKESDADRKGGILSRIFR